MLYVANKVKKCSFFFVVKNKVLIDFCIKNTVIKSLKEDQFKFIHKICFIIQCNYITSKQNLPLFKFILFAPLTNLYIPTTNLI